MATFFQYIIFISILLTLIASCKEEKSEQVFKYSSGTVKQRIPMVNGKKHGEMLEYYLTGDLKSRTQFVNDKQSGKTIYYFKSGKIQEIQYFNENKLDNGDTSFYENGAIEKIVEFTKGLKNGYVKKFDTTGVLYFNAKYKMDTLIEVKGVPLQR